MIRAGKLRRKITIQQTTETRSDMGGVIDGWGTFAVRRASVEPVSGKKYFDSQTDNSELTTVFRLRYLPGVTGKMRVVYNSDNYEILGPPINSRERDKEILILCKKIE